MIEDVLAVAWKEWRELVKQRTTRVGGLIMIFVFGISLPLNQKVSNFATPFQALSFAVVPFVLTIPIIADSIAGERERHTLETLLATRLTEADILLGKVGVTVA